MNDIIEDSIVRYLKERIRSIMNERADYVSTGACQDFADYKHHVGVIEGLALAERELLDVAERLERAE